VKQFLYRLQPTRLGMLTEGPTEHEASVVAAHFAYLLQLIDEGTGLMAGRTLVESENTFGVVVFEAESEDFARRVMENDPAVINGVMVAQLFPFRVALWSEKGPTTFD
jgi:uncharacterized protein YciI